MKNRNTTRGMTIFEFVITLSLICILGGIFIPPILNTISRSRVLAASAVSTALNMAVFMAVTQYHNNHDSTSTSITVNGKTVTVERGTGLPTGDPLGIGAMLNAMKGFEVSYGSVTEYNFSPLVKNCYVAYDSHTGQVSLVTVGC